MVYRLGLSPRRRPSEPLAPDEWWVRDLSDELGVSYLRFKDWVKKGYVHVRSVSGKRHLVIWADAEDRERLGRLRDYHWPGRLNHYPVELTRPKARSDQKRGRRAWLPVMRMTLGLIGRNLLSLAMGRQKKQP